MNESRKEYLRLENNGTPISYAWQYLDGLAQLFMRGPVCHLALLGAMPDEFTAGTSFKLLSLFHTISANAWWVNNRLRV